MEEQDIFKDDDKISPEKKKKKDDKIKKSLYKTALED